MGKHNFCSITRYCRRCGIPIQLFAESDKVIHCYPTRAPVVSLDWWKQLKRYERIAEQLVKELDSALS